ncbi:hypothetical protein DQ238_16080 [Geodermatophilus sp. TF02-6]|uniref:hypothetical protein n=1 Tax=Geodermatophilus sp. TF02-6 TaxID=2250575 RepID=UPI000DEBC3E9|nr:hypothetical protein [Geodermatophilus sp. TF02-6]RBY76789.1 hypothetical protein DQ238_16080 [Geodermatophilus sp. TF02-6]
MSQGTADTTTSGDPWTGADTRPQAPSFTATLDQVHGVVRTRGHLDALAADLLSGSIVALQRQGHRELTVQLRPLATIDADARRLLTDLAGRLAVDGVRLTFE